MLPIGTIFPTIATLLNVFLCRGPILGARRKFFTRWTCPSRCGRKSKAPQDWKLRPKERRGILTAEALSCRKGERQRKQEKGRHHGGQDWHQANLAGFWRPRS